MRPWLETSRLAIASETSDSPPRRKLHRDKREMPDLRMAGSNIAHLEEASLLSAVNHSNLHGGGKCPRISGKGAIA